MAQLKQQPQQQLAVNDNYPHTNAHVTARTSERAKGRAGHTQRREQRQAGSSSKRGFTLHRLDFAEVFTLAAALYRAKHA